MQHIFFETPRLHLRPLALSDWEVYRVMQGSEQVMRYIKPVGTEEEIRAELERIVGHYQTDDLFYQIAGVEWKETGELIGLAGIYKNQKEEYEIAYRFLEAYWGQGLGTEVVKGILRYGFETLALPTLVAYVDPQNTGSVRILERFLGFTGQVLCFQTMVMDRRYQLDSKDYEPTAL